MTTPRPDYMPRNGDGWAIVRKMTSNRTHWVEASDLIFQEATSFGAPFWAFEFGLTVACGVHLRPSPHSAIVAMKPQTEVCCIACRRARA